VYSTAISPDARVYAVGQVGTERIDFWDLESGRYLGARPRDPNDFIGTPHLFSRDGKTLLSKVWPNEIRIIDMTTPQKPYKPLRYKSWTRAVACSPDGGTIAVAGDDHLIHVIERNTLQEMATLRGQSQGVVGLAFSPDGRTIASCGDGGIIKLWSLPAAREVATLVTGPEFLEFIAFSTDGNSLICAAARVHQFRVPSLAEIDAPH
jgi:WD40 repeat protein